MKPANSSLDRFRQELARTWQVRRRVDWSDPAYSAEKAYLMAVFAKIAYLVIPAFELPSHSLAKIIPCLDYQRLLALGQRIEINEFLRRADFPDVFVLESERAIAVGVIRQDMIVVALRGTRPLYVSDWAIDFKASQVTIHGQRLKARLHAGFLSATLEFAEELAARVRERTAKFDRPPPVYLTGHSLGGALAATISALNGLDFFSRFRLGTDVRFDLPVHSTYTFGMPRYGDDTAMHTLPPPWHTINRDDLVPGLPPRWLGFADSPREFLAEGKTLLPLAQRASPGLADRVQRALRLRGIRQHFVERYIQQLARTL